VKENPAYGVAMAVTTNYRVPVVLYSPDGEYAEIQ